MKAVDVMGFAGSFAAGVDQAGFDIVSKREPAKFKGFGMDSVLYNMPWIDGQVAPPEDWDGPAEPDIDFLYGCPPCSGFSQLSFANTLVHGAVVGPDAEINECMTWFVDYAARVKAPVVVMESVAVAFKNGKEFMEALWERLRERSGVDYMLTHVVMNNTLVGGDVIRPRYFMVAHTEPFGVGLEFVAPRNAIDVIQDLGQAEDTTDLDWGHMVKRGSGIQRWKSTFEWLAERGLEWEPGTRLPDIILDREDLKNDPPPFWLKSDGPPSERAASHGITRDVYSHWFSTDPFSTFRWRPDKPYGVVVGAVLDRAVHPTAPRTLTWREAARFMTLPDTWSLRSLVERQAAAELGKAVTGAAGKWIAHWAKMCLEGTPGEYAGRPDPKDGVRVIDVRDQKRVDEILRNPPAQSFYTSDYADPDPATWLIDRKERPDTWWQYEEAVAAGRYADAKPSRREKAPAKVEKTAAKATKTPAPATVRGGVIERIPPERVAALIQEVGIDKKEAARRLGVSVSRVNELTTHTRPKSWLNAARWAETKEAIRAG